jgi:hypothetical protein
MENTCPNAAVRCQGNMLLNRILEKAFSWRDLLSACCLPTGVCNSTNKTYFF